jgi:hypothetical protein
MNVNKVEAGNLILPFLSTPEKKRREMQSIETIFYYY